jgi:hypothetical protein
MRPPGVEKRRRFRFYHRYRRSLTVNDSFRYARNCFAAAVVALAATVAPAMAANTMYLDFASGGTQGEATPKSAQPPKGTWIQISSFQFGAGKASVAPSSASAAGAARRPATIESMDATVSGTGMKTVFDLAATGRAIPFVMLYEFRQGKSGLVPVYTAKMSDVMVSSTDWKGNGDRPTANVTLNYRAVEIQKNLKSDSDDPAVLASWNMVTNKPQP